MIDIKHSDMTKHLAHEIETSVQTFNAIFNELRHLTIEVMFTVENFNKGNLLATATTRKGRQSIIKLSQILISNISIDDQKHLNVLRELLYHELSHIVCDHLYPNAAAHGKEFKYIMARVGYPQAKSTILIPKELESNSKTPRKKTRYIFVNQYNKEFPLTKKWFTLYQKGMQLSIEGETINFLKKIIVD